MIKSWVYIFSVVALFPSSCFAMVEFNAGSGYIVEENGESGEISTDVGISVQVLDNLDFGVSARYFIESQDIKPVLIASYSLPLFNNEVVPKVNVGFEGDKPMVGAGLKFNLADKWSVYGGYYTAYDDSNRNLNYGFNLSLSYSLTHSTISKVVSEKSDTAIRPVTETYTTTTEADNKQTPKYDEGYHNTLYYMVKKGDWLYKIARHNHLSLSKLIELNSWITPRLKYNKGSIFPDEIIVIEQGGRGGLPSTGRLYYIVENGDNISTIAKKNQLSINQLVRLNGFLSSRLKYYRGLIFPSEIIYLN